MPQEGEAGAAMHPPHDPFRFGVHAFGPAVVVWQGHRRVHGCRASARFRQENAMSIPYRDRSVDAVVTDPPYCDMIEYADTSDLFHVWLKRVLPGIEPDLSGPEAVQTKDGLQNKNDEIMVRRVHEPGAENAAFRWSRPRRDIRRAIFQALSGSGPCEVVDGNGEALAISPLDAGFGIPGHNRPRAVVKVRA